jgi:hypothetical protein
MSLKFGQRKLIVMATLAFCAVGSACAAGLVQHADDSVRRNGEVNRPPATRSNPGEKVVIPPLAHYLMKQAVLASSVGLNEVRFSGFKNNSPYPLVIALEYAGAPQDKHSSLGVVNGIGVASSIYASTFEVPPGASYGFNVQSTFVISAWVVAGIDEDSDAAAQAAWIASQRQTGLPTQEMFARPIRQGYAYRGCVEYRMNGQPTENYYYYSPGRWTDGSDPTRDAEIVPEFGWVVRAGAPVNPGRCAVVRDLQQVGSPDNGGGL